MASTFLTATSGSSPIWSSSGTSGTATTYTLGTSYGPAAPMAVNQGGKISLTGPDADVDINGMSLKDTLKAIQQRLGILEVNKELEADFEQLQELGRQYRELEAQLLEQKQVFDILKNENIK